MKTPTSISSALLSGFIATAAMTAFTYMAPLMGLEMNIPQMLASTMGLPIIFGWIAHLMIGEILALNYAIIFVNRFNRSSDLKSGMLFGIIPWLAAQIMVMPMMNIMNGGSFTSALFSGSFLMSMASLIGHLIFGAVLGAIYKPSISTSPQIV